MNKYFYKPYMAVVLCVLSVNPSVQADEHSIHIKINTQTGAINQRPRSSKYELDTPNGW